MNFLSQILLGRLTVSCKPTKPVVIFREEKSDCNTFPTKTSMEEKLNAKLSNITSSPDKE